MVDLRGRAFAGRGRRVRFRCRHLPASGLRRVWPFLATGRRAAALEFLDHLAGWVKALAGTGQEPEPDELAPAAWQPSSAQPVHAGV